MRILTPLLVVCVLALSGCWPMCVQEGTMIATPSGDRAIETIHVGDEVLTMSPQGEIAIGAVTEVHNGMSSRWVAIEAGESKVIVTPKHMVATSHGWAEASSIGPDGVVRGRDSLLEVTSQRTERSLTRAYDLSVEPNNNYFANGFLVHNKTVVPPVRPSEIFGTWVATSRWGYVYVVRFDADGTGDAILISHLSEDEHEIPSWSLDEYDFEFTMATNFTDNRLRSFRGRAWSNLLSVADGEESLEFVKSDLAGEPLRTAIEKLQLGASDDASND